MHRNPHSPLRYYALAAAALAMAACKPSRWDTPEVAYNTFSTALKKSDEALAWEGLSKASVAAIEKRVAEAKAVAPEVLKGNAASIVMSSGRRAMGAEKVRVVERDSTHAILEVTVKGVTFREQLVVEDGLWKIDLTPQL